MQHPGSEEYMNFHIARDICGSCANALKERPADIGEFHRFN